MDLSSRYFFFCKSIPSESTIKSVIFSSGWKKIDSLTSFFPVWLSSLNYFSTWNLTQAFCLARYFKFVEHDDNFVRDAHKTNQKLKYFRFHCVAHEQYCTDIRRAFQMCFKRKICCFWHSCWNSLSLIFYA